jgi:hypothetical protein
LLRREHRSRGANSKHEEALPSDFKLLANAIEQASAIEQATSTSSQLEAKAKKRLSTPKYEVLKTGKCDKEISSLSECSAAAKELSRGDQWSDTIKDRTKPSHCYEDGNTLYFNVDGADSCSSTRPCLCKKVILQVDMPAQQEQDKDQQEIASKLLSPEMNRLKGAWKSTSGNRIAIYEDVLKFEGAAWKLKTAPQVTSRATDIMTYSVTPSSSTDTFADGFCHLRSPQWYDKIQAVYLMCGTDKYIREVDLKAYWTRRRTGTPSWTAPTVPPVDTEQYKLAPGAAEADVITAPADIWKR